MLLLMNVTFFFIFLNRCKLSLFVFLVVVFVRGVLLHSTKLLFDRTVGLKIVGSVEATLFLCCRIFSLDKRLYPRLFLATRGVLIVTSDKILSSYQVEDFLELCRVCPLVLKTTTCNIRKCLAQN